MPPARPDRATCGQRRRSWTSHECACLPSIDDCTAPPIPFSRGGEVACRLYSLILSCKQAGVDPERYIEDVLGKLSTTKASDIATLTPWAWAAARS